MASVEALQLRSGSPSSESGSSSDENPEGYRMKSAVVVKQAPDPAQKRLIPQEDEERESPPPPAKRFKEAPPAPATVAAVASEAAGDEKKKEQLDSILTRTGGAYIPPARLRMMQESITDKTSVAYQRLAWEALKKSINGLINKINVSNISNIVRELFQENIVRGRGLLARSVIQAQVASPTFTHVYAAMVAILNTKFPQTGELVAKRLILQFRKGFRRNDKTVCLSSVRFIAHLVNQHVLHELLALELMTLLLESPTDDSVEVAVGFLKECGQKLTELSPRGTHGVFESLRGILHQGLIDKRVQYMIEVMFAVRKDGFKDHPAVIPELDLVEEDDQITHLLSIEDEYDGEDALNVFRYDNEFLENEERYKAIKEEILGGGGSSSESGEEGEEEDGEEEGEEGGGEAAGLAAMQIQDETHTNLLALRRTIYLTIMSSLDFEECAHKVLKMELKPGQETEVAHMLIECCSQERSYQKFYGLLAQRFCLLNQMWVECFDKAFQEQYTTVHRLETNKLRNVAKFFGQLFYADALPWTSMSCVHLNEEETNSSSRIFVKILFQELAEYMGLQKLNERLRDPFLAVSFEGLMPRDNPKNTRFAINFFTSIGLGGLTDDLREHLKNAPKLIMAQQHEDVESSDTSSGEEEEEEESSSSEESSSASGSDDGSSSSASEKEKKSAKKVKDKKGKIADNEGRKVKRGKKTDKDGAEPAKPVHQPKRASVDRETDQRNVKEARRARNGKDEERGPERSEQVVPQRSGKDWREEKAPPERELEQTDARHRGREKEERSREKEERGREKQDRGRGKEERGREEEIGKDKQDRGRDKKERGREKEERGREEEERGRDTEERGRDKEERGRDKEERGRDKEERGRDKEERGRGGRDKEEVGREREERGRDKEEVGREREERGRDKEERGRDKEERGKDKEERGRDKEERGRGGRDKEEVGREREERGRDKEERGRDKEERGRDKEERGRGGRDKEERGRGGREREERGRDKEERGRDKEERGRDKEDRGKVDGEKRWHSNSAKEETVPESRRRMQDTDVDRRER